MDTDFLRDHLFTTMWFGLMTMVWLGWAQERPDPSWRPWLGAGSVAGTLLAIGFGILVARHWSDPSALEGRYQWFGVLVLVELLLAGAGSLVLAHRGDQRWTAWWVAIVVAAHFLPLAWLLRDWTIAALGVVELVALAVAWTRLTGGTLPTSRVVGPLMGITLLAYAVAAAATAVPRLRGD